MPKIKTSRTDILRKPEVDMMLKNAENVYMGQRLQCVIVLAWIFGKRIKEILRLKREDIWTDDKFLYVRFQVQKKKHRRELPIPETYTKKIRLEHPYVPYVLRWVNRIQEGYVFPSYTKPRIIRVKTKWKNEKGETVEKEYSYTLEGGHLSDARLRQLIKQVNPNAWWHLFRESLATYMSEMGATEEELMHWFDWSDPKTAHNYVKRGTKLIEKWAERNW
jgi:integrase